MTRELIPARTRLEGARLSVSKGCRRDCGVDECRRDHPRLMATYADDVVFHSPVTAVEFQGKDAVGTLMNHVIAGFESWERTFVVADEEQCVFGARGRIAGQTVELAELIRLAPDGRVSEIRIHGRPLAGIAAIAAVAAPPLAAR